MAINNSKGTVKLNNVTINVNSEAEKVISTGANTVTEIVGGSITSAVADDNTSILVWNNAKLSIKGTTISGAESAIMGNGTQPINEIIIEDGANISSVGSAIYMPSTGTLTIKDSTISGGTGIEVLAGTVNITDSTINGTLETYKTSGDKDGDGTVCDGSAIFVRSQTDYNNDGTLNLTISGTTTLTSADGYGIRVYESSKGTGVNTINISYPEATVFTVKDAEHKTLNETTTVNVSGL